MYPQSQLIEHACKYYLSLYWLSNGPSFFRFYFTEQLSLVVVQFIFFNVHFGHASVYQVEQKYFPKYMLRF